jgi:hypothetical protein
LNEKGLLFTRNNSLRQNCRKNQAQPVDFWSVSNTVLDLIRHGTGLIYNVQCDLYTGTVNDISFGHRTAVSRYRYWYWQFNSSGS